LGKWGYPGMNGYRLMKGVSHKDQPLNRNRRLAGGILAL